MAEKNRIRRKELEPWMTVDQMRTHLRNASDHVTGILFLAELNGCSSGTICRMLGIEPIETIRLTPLLRSYGWTEEKVKRVRDMYFVEGDTIAKIAEEMGISYNAVQRMLASASGGWYAPLPCEERKRRSESGDSPSGKVKI